MFYGVGHSWRITDPENPERGVSGFSGRERPFYRNNPAILRILIRVRVYKKNRLLELFCAVYATLLAIFLSAPPFSIRFLRIALAAVRPGLKPFTTGGDDE